MACSGASSTGTRVQMQVGDAAVCVTLGSCRCSCNCGKPQLRESSLACCCRASAAQCHPMYKGFFREERERREKQLRTKQGFREDKN
jgi:hypothetical protein